MNLSSYDYTIRYRPGCEKHCADALSRLPLSRAPITVPVREDVVLSTDVFDSDESPITAKQIESSTRTNPPYQLSYAAYRQVIGRYPTSCMMKLSLSSYVNYNRLDMQDVYSGAIELSFPDKGGV